MVHHSNLIISSDGLLILGHSKPGGIVHLKVEVALEILSKVVKRALLLGVAVRKEESSDP